MIPARQCDFVNRESRTNEIIQFVFRKSMETAIKINLKMKLHKSFEIYLRTFDLIHLISGGFESV